MKRGKVICGLDVDGERDPLQLRGLVEKERSRRRPLAGASYLARRPGVTGGAGVSGRARLSKKLLLLLLLLPILEVGELLLQRSLTAM